MRGCNANDVAPLVIQLDVFANGGSGAEQAVLSRGAENTDWRRRGIVRLVEEASFGNAEVADFEVIGLDAVYDRSILLRLGQEFAWCKTLPRRPTLNIADVVPNNLIIG